MTVSAELKEALLAQETDEVYLVLLTLDHPDLESPIRVVNDHVNHYSRGQDNATDASPNGHNGTVNGSARYTDGYLRGGLRFTSDDDWLEIGNHANLNITGALTVEMWVKPDELQDDGLLIRCGQGNDTCYALYCDSTGKLEYRWYDGAHQVSETSGAVLSTEEWSHVALTRNSAGTSIKLYVDGVEVAAATVTAPTGPGGILTIGGLNSDLLTHKFRGTVDDVRIWDIERTAQDIQDTMNEELEGTEDNLQGYWKLNEGVFFVGFNFNIIMPTDMADAPPTARLTIDNVSQEIAIAIRSISTPPSVTIEVVRGAVPDEVEMLFEGFVLRNVRWDVMTVQGDLIVEDFAVEPFPAGIFTPSRFPGLF